MSWDDYCTHVCTSASCVSNAVLIGYEGALWGSTNNSGFAATTEEVTALAKAAQKASKGDSSDFVASGPKLSGEKYMFLAHEKDLTPQVVRLRKGANGVIIALMNTAALCAVYQAVAQNSGVEAEKAVVAVASGLIGSGY